MAERERKLETGKEERTTTESETTEWAVSRRDRKLA